MTGVRPIGKIMRLNVALMRESVARFAEGWVDLTLMLKSPTINSLSTSKSSKTVPSKLTEVGIAADWIVENRDADVQLIDLELDS